MYISKKFSLTIRKTKLDHVCFHFCYTDERAYKLQIPPDLYTAFLASIEKGNIKTMPNRSMPGAPYPTPGALLMGDAFNMRHPLTGGGMTVALSDVLVVRNLLRPLQNLDSASALCKYLEAFYTLRKVRRYPNLIFIG